MRNTRTNRGWAAVMVAAILMMLAWATAAPSQDGTTFKLLHSFDLTDGTYPYAPLVQASTGNLFGTTGEAGPHDSGTIFRIDPITGQLTTVYGFCSQSGCVDGVLPGGSWLIQTADGNFYSTTYEGGSYGYGRRRHRLQNHPKWHADDVAQLCRFRWQQPRRRAAARE